MMARCRHAAQRRIWCIKQALPLVFGASERTPSAKSRHGMKAWCEGMEAERDTIEFVQTRCPNIPVPEVIFA